MRMIMNMKAFDHHAFVLARPTPARPPKITANIVLPIAAVKELRITGAMLSSTKRSKYQPLSYRRRRSCQVRRWSPPRSSTCCSHTR